MNITPRAAVIGAISVSIIVMLGFCGVTVAMFFGSLGTALRDQMAPIVFNGWLALATGVVGFWIGSSVGSMQKNTLLTPKP